MRIIHSNQFTSRERTEYRNDIASNIATSLFTLLDVADWTSVTTKQSEDKVSFQLALQVFQFYHTERPKVTYHHNLIIPARNRVKHIIDYYICLLSHQAK